MLFNSITYLIFLPIVFFIYWFALQHNLKKQNLFVVIASYVFYGWWDWRFLLMIVFTSLCSWASGLLMQYIDKKNSPHPCISRKFISICNILLNLGILGFFKYYNFFVSSFIGAFSQLGIHLHAHTLNIILPVGISFYTFQALSYSIDVYKRKIEPTDDMIAFFAYIGFFPLLVAGPIERATNLLPQFLKKRTFNYDQAVDGLRQILWGLFKKVVIADNCASYVNMAFNNPHDHTGSTLLLGAVFFAFQIYGDFSGYSDIAIGSARLFGINAMRNFAFPYFSRDIAEFWRRWHISLTTWFRDYVYIPLGGSRGNKSQVVRNTFIIFAISGFWHGANWTFIAWGIFHALLFIPLILLDKNRRNTNIVAENRLLPSIKDIIQMSTTFLLVVIGWVFFRADSISHAFDYLVGIFDLSLFSKPYLRAFVYRFLPLFSMLAILIGVEWVQRHKEHGLQLSDKIPKPVRWGIYCIMIYLIHRYQGDSSTFIYFQF